tara:strand:- start:1965 stop:2390 length:426 start_codon:yes stop_codon:yes gene_type:complete
MGNQLSLNKINFEDIQDVIKNKHNYILISTLGPSLQNCLIKETIPLEKEEALINELIQQKKMSKAIVIYGKNASDESIYNKYDQLIKLGFSNVFLYCGGMFEWLMLQDIFGDDIFLTNKKELDFLKYKSNQIFNKLYITND